MPLEIGASIISLGGYYTRGNIVKAVRRASRLGIGIHMLPLTGVDRRTVQFIYDCGGEVLTYGVDDESPSLFNHTLFGPSREEVIIRQSLLARSFPFAIRVVYEYYDVRKGDAFKINPDTLQINGISLNEVLNRGMELAVDFGHLGRFSIYNENFRVGNPIRLLGEIPAYLIRTVHLRPEQWSDIRDLMRLRSTPFVRFYSTLFDMFKSEGGRNIPLIIETSPAQMKELGPLANSLRRRHGMY